MLAEAGLRMDDGGWIWRLVVATSILAVVLAVLRELIFDSSQLRFLLWNLVLAWIPPLLAVSVRAVSRSEVYGWAWVPLGCLWLVFLPNSPYMLTDFIHLRTDGSGPLPFDVVVIGIFSGTGLVLWFLSLFILQAIVRDRFGSRTGWALAAASIALTGVGIYLGRVLRWNSWDLIVQPEHRLDQLTRYPSLETVAQACAFSLVGAAVLALGYTLFYVAAHTGLRSSEDRVAIRRLPG